MISVLVLALYDRPGIAAAAPSDALIWDDLDAMTWDDGDALWWD